MLIKIDDNLIINSKQIEYAEHEHYSLTIKLYGRNNTINIVKESEVYRIWEDLKKASERGVYNA